MMLLEAKNIYKRFTKHTALDDVSISIPESNVSGLLGPNGAGKTTFLRIINQITAPDKGQLFFKGKALKRDDISRIGYLPEERGLYKKMKVGEQAIYLAQLKGLSRNEARKRLKHWFEKFEIISWWDKKVKELSKGMAQKVQFIITVLHEPELLIFDEPFSGFDPINANIIKNEILDLKKNGATIIFSTHDMPSVEAICDHIVLINNSKKILDGNIRTIKNDYKNNVYKLRYIGNLDLPKEVCSVIEYASEGSEITTKVQVNEGQEKNMLTLLAHKVELKEFKEITPSMNDIFIQKVSENNNVNV